MRERILRLNLPVKSWVKVWVMTMIVGLLTMIPAQAQVTNGTIEVMTVDKESTVIPGATVIALNSETGLQRQTVTNLQGLAIIRSLPPGSYNITITLDGFAAYEQKNVVLYTGQKARFNVIMVPSTEESITITAETPIVEVYKSDASTNITPEQIEQLPVLNRDFEKLAFITPGVQRERGDYRFVSGGPVIGASGNASQSTIIVDGADFTDQALGQARARISQDAIREFKVISNRFDSEIGNSAGGAMTVVTKSGTNDFKGTVFGFYRNDALRTQGELETGEQDYTRYQTGFTLGGPIKKDKTHFFLSAEYIDQKDITGFRPLGAFADQAADIKQPFDQLMLMGSLDHIINESQTLSAKMVYETYNMDNFRVGGIADVSYGQSLERDNWNVVLNHTWMLSDTALNEFQVQFGHRKYFEPTNSDNVTEWFSSGTTLQTGANIVGDLLGEGDYLGFSDTFRLHTVIGNTTHDFKFGVSVQNIKERSDIPVYSEGLWIYLTDDRTLPLAYAYGTGSADVELDTTLFGFFAQDDIQVTSNLKLTFGVRYDLDTDGANQDFTHPLTGDRGRDTNNIQPRVSFVWDSKGDGSTVVRGGVGLFTGRYLLVPAFTEMQQNGISGRILTTNVNGLLYGLPPAYWLNPADPEHSGIPLPPDITLLQDNLEAPESVQATLGFTKQLGDTGLYFDLEAIYSKGDNEIVVRDTNFGGNDNPVRLNPLWNQINMYTNDGRSKYKALIASINGTLNGGHIITASFTFADKKNISDDFSPAFPFGYPSDPFDIDAEWGRSRNDEKFRAVITGVFKLPMDFTLAPIIEYGSGQPWNSIIGSDSNGDGKNSDRSEGVERNSMDGPKYKNVSVRLTKSVEFYKGRLDFILEGFNIFDFTNYNVTSVDNAESSDTYGTYRATLDPRTIQLGMRYSW